MKTVAIVGSHPRTSKKFDFSRTDCDVWVFNEAMSADWCKRADGVFQMHDPIIWKNPANRNDPKHYEWLKSGNTPTIFMMEKYEEVPMSEKYPLDEVLSLSGGLKKLTSSVAHAIALAIIKGYEAIEIYGVEMETNTEYQYQKDGVIFWIGLAIGKGIKVIQHTKIFDDPIYGYEGSTTVKVEDFTAHIESDIAYCKEKEKEYEEKKKELSKIINDFKVTGKDEGQKLIHCIHDLSTLAAEYGKTDGHRQECERYKNKADKMIAESGGYNFSRQEFEFNAAHMRKTAAEEIAKAQGLAGQMQAIYDEMLMINNKKRRIEKLQRFGGALIKFVEATGKVGVFDGGSLANIEFLQRTDVLIRMAGGQKSLEVMNENRAEP
jgi:hypothetical protein